VTYNSYLIKGEKTALIDLTKSIKGDEYLSMIEEITAVSKIDYIVINHMEPDHTGLLRIFRRLAPQAVILGSAKTKDMLRGFFGVEDNVRAVADGETLDLGGATLRFLSTPFVHWPETIMTYEESRKVLFSCDGFGGYGALRGTIFDDECVQPEFYEKEALRYYANIVANYSSRVLDAIAKLAALPVDIIAPSHGLVWRRSPQRIVDLYRRWAECASGKTEPAATLVYGSMYGNTERMMNAVAIGISEAGVPVEVFDAARTHVSYILPSLWTKSGVMIGAPTYEVKLFPPMAEVLNMAVNKRVLGRKAAYFGSYGWSGGALKEVKRIIEPAKWELGETLEFIGSPKPEDLAKGLEFGRRFAERIKAGG
ncbi:MAG: flavodoxin/nitric oxide synthase, partial [Candidatus Aminicenantes bacterium]|nr:flavodoxin/nitric oxide synthase [Candidatus Aminicenantes bacterium]